MKLPKTKQAWREREYKDCTYIPLEGGQKFIGGKKVVLLYHSSKKAEGGFVDAMWIERIEIHHLKGEHCTTYFSDERRHDALQLSQNWRGSLSRRPAVTDVKIQRDGATQLSIFDDFEFQDYQAAELMGI